MAKIPLRAYIEEINSIIDHKQTEEAIAHCRHILHTYPKHIETYSMLGKAYLESQRYGNAADIFQRVLSSMPDDFISHVGMSIIREDEHNLDAAIWHMERAFENQPYNAAIQGELRRLYGRRDGMEPPKVHLTRGALARMYAKGNLFQQAISELRTALTEDPQRYDLQVLLAQMYTLNNQDSQALETSSALVVKLPYCLVANRILANTLEKTDRAEEAKTFKIRLQELDPYEAFISSNAPTAAHVPAQAITIEQMIWDGGPATATPDQPEWAASVGISLGSSNSADEGLPDWLSTTSEDAPALPALLDAESTPGDDPIPDWMKEAGWGPSSGEFDESQSAFSFDDDDDEPETETRSEAVAGELPDWLEKIAPPDALDTSELSAETLQGDIPDWLGDQTETTPEETATWLEDESPALANEEGDASLPDWLQGSDQEKDNDDGPFLIGSLRQLLGLLER